MTDFRRPNAWILFWTLAALAFGLLLLDLGEVFGQELHVFLHTASLVVFAAAGAALLPALRQSRAKSAANIAAGRELVADLMDSVPDGLALWAANGTLMAYNDAFLRKRQLPDAVRPGLAYRDFVANALAKGRVTDGGGDSLAYLARRLAAFEAADGAPHEVVKTDGAIEEVRFFRARGGGVVGVYRDVTELRRREAELEIERARQADILAAIPDGIVLWNAQNRIASVNPAAARIPMIGGMAEIGIDFFEFARRSMTTVVAAESGPPPTLEQRLASQAKPTGEPQEYGYVDGSWIEIRKFRARDGGVVAIYRDITARKRDEKRLEVERGRLQDIMDAIPDTIAMWDKDLRLIAFNRNAGETRTRTGRFEIGMTFDERTQALVEAGFATDDAERFAAGRRAAILDPTGEPTEESRPDGRIDEIRRFPSREGGVVVVARDVTERKRAVAELERQRHLLQEIMDALPDGLQVWGPDGKLVAFNRKAAEQRASAVPLSLGVNYADFVRRSAYSGSIPEIVGAEEAYIEQRLAEHASPAARSTDILRADGQWEEMRKVPTSDGGRLSLFRDVTETRRAQSELRAQRDELARRLEERERLMAERDSAEAASRAKTEFLAMMSHELRTPMNGVIATTGLLARTRLNDDQRRYLDTVQRSAQSLLTIIDDVLDWAKLEEGRIEIESVDCSPAQIAENVVSLLRPAADQKGIGLALELDPALPEFGRLDPARLRQILLNLVGNAVKFTAEGHVRVRLKAQPRVDGGEGALLSLEVEDSGIGIAPNSLPTLFDRFTQADGSIARRFGGTGLGLAIVKRLLDLMGGTIEVNSHPGIGSRFAARLPMAPGKRPETLAPPLLPAPARALKLLVAEDNAINRMVVEHLLRELGHSAEFALDGAAAVTKARAGDYDAILMDVQMPETDGMEATKLIRALEGPRARVPIVALTANAMVGDRERYLEAGMDDYVSKPIDAYELAAALARVANGMAPAMPGTTRGRPSPPIDDGGRAALAGLVQALRRSTTNCN